MPLSKIQAQSMNLADTFAFTGTVSGVGGIVPLTTVTAGSSTTNLDWTGASSTYGTTNEASSNNANSNAASKIVLRNNHGGAGTNEDMTGWFYFINPKISTKRTGVTILYNGENTSGNHIAGITLGAFTSETEQNGFRIYVSSGNLDGSTAQIYGIVKL